MKTRQQAPDWVYERFYENACKELEHFSPLVMEWMISKVTMIATLNYCRGKGLVCNWIEKYEGCFMIQIKKVSTTTSE